MGSSERHCIRWTNFESNIKHGFSELLKDEEFFDVTLACGSKQVKAHKVILSACSPFFRSLIKSLSHSHPLLYLRGIHFPHLEYLITFMYNGEVSVSMEELGDFLAIAEEFQIRGLHSLSCQVPSSYEAPLTPCGVSSNETLSTIPDDTDDEVEMIKEEHAYIQDFMREATVEGEELDDVVDISSLESKAPVIPNFSSSIVQTNEDKEPQQKITSDISGTESSSIFPLEKVSGQEEGDNLPSESSKSQAHWSNLGDNEMKRKISRFPWNLNELFVVDKSYEGTNIFMKCQICEKSVSARTFNLRRHINNVHSDQLLRFNFLMESKKYGKSEMARFLGMSKTDIEDSSPEPEDSATPKSSILEGQQSSQANDDDDKVRMKISKHPWPHLKECFAVDKSCVGKVTTLKCQICEKSVSSRTFNLRRHIMTMHSTYLQRFDFLMERKKSFKGGGLESARLRQRKNKDRFITKLKFNRIQSLKTAAGRKMSLKQEASSSAVSHKPPLTETPSHQFTEESMKNKAGHLATWNSTQERCTLCPPGIYSFVKCAKCDLHFCVNKTRNCFIAYHSKL